MIFLLNCIIKASAILAIALLVVRLLRRRSAAIRHCVLAAGILSAAVSPGLSLLMPAWNIRIPIEVSRPESISGPATSTEQETVVLDSSESAARPAPHMDSSKADLSPLVSATSQDISVPLASSEPSVQTRTKMGTALRHVLQSHWILQVRHPSGSLESCWHWWRFWAG